MCTIILYFDIDKNEIIELAEIWELIFRGLEAFWYIILFLTAIFSFSVFCEIS